MACIRWAWDPDTFSGPHFHIHQDPIPAYAFFSLDCTEVSQAWVPLDTHDIRPEAHLSVSKVWASLFESWGFQRKCLLSLLYSPIIHEQWRVGGQRDPPSLEEAKGKNSVS